MESAGRAVMDFARVSGESADKVTSLMQPMFEDPTKGAAKLNETMHFLTIAQYDQIKAMQEHGNKAGALKVAMDAMDASITSQTTQLGYLAQAWKWVKEQANGFWRAMVDWGKTDTVEEVGKKLQKTSMICRRGSTPSGWGKAGAATSGPARRLRKSAWPR